VNITGQGERLKITEILEIPENVRTVFRNPNVSENPESWNVPGTPEIREIQGFWVSSCSGVYEVEFRNFGVFSRQISDFRKFRKMSGRFSLRDGNFLEFLEIPRVFSGFCGFTAVATYKM
jgi:hypothetical protein